MSESPLCPKCGIQLPADAPAGLCPICLVQAGFESQPMSGLAEPGPTKLTPPNSGFVPPTVEELAPLFPQLEILELLGKGGMGAVYKARQPGLDRLVALKILPPEISRDPAFAERFQREARALAKLSHPHIVAVYDFGTTKANGGRQPPGAASSQINQGADAPRSPSLCYIVMEFVDGANLRQTIRAGKLAAAEALAIVPQICEALQFAHDEGIVHRDIKPENILIDKRGRVKIADFGLAKLLGQNASDHSLTATHQVMGTLRYMAPEQMQGSREVDHRADIYSLGVVFYELLTGELPMGRFAPPSKRVQVDVRLDEIVLRALEQEPEQRYQHASEVKSAVEVVSGSLAAQAVPAPEIRETEEVVSAGDVVRQSFLVLLSIVGTLSLFMPWTRVTFGQTFPDGGGSFVTLAVHGVYHWFPVFGALLSAALLFVTLLSIGRCRRPLRAIFAIAAGLALASSSLFTIIAQPLTVHPKSYSAMVEEMDEWSAHVKSGASALAELVRLSQAADRWTPGTTHVSIHAEPFFGSWTALGTGLLLLLLGSIEFRSVVWSSLDRMTAAPLQAAAEPAQALRLTGLLGPAALLIMLLMNMSDVFINGGGAGSQPWSLLRTLLIAAFAVHLFHACFITPWILFGATRLRTLSSPGAVRAASILAMLPLNVSAFVGIPAALWSLLVLRGGVTGAESSTPKTLSGQRANSDAGPNPMPLARRSTNVERELRGVWNWVSGDSASSNQPPVFPGRLMILLSLAGCLMLMVPWLDLHIAQDANVKQFWNNAEMPGAFSRTLYGSERWPGIVTGVAFGLLTLLLIMTPGRLPLSWRRAAVMSVIAAGAVSTTFLFKPDLEVSKFTIPIVRYEDARLAGLSSGGTIDLPVGEERMERVMSRASVPLKTIEHQVMYREGYYGSLALSVVLLVFSSIGVRHAVARGGEKKTVTAPVSLPPAATTLKRPKLVPVLAAFNLVGAILLMLVCAMKPAAFVQPVPLIWQVWEQVDAVLGFAMAAGMFAASIGLFLWKPWARKLTLGVCIFGLASFVFDAPYLARFALPDAYVEIQRTVIAEGVDPDLQDFVTLITFVVLFGGLLLVGMTFLIGQLVYFTRPRVVAAFESQSEKSGRFLDWLFTGVGAVVGVLSVFGPLALLLGLAALFNAGDGEKTIDPPGHRADSKTGEVWFGNKGAEIVMFLGPNDPAVSDRLASHLGLDLAQRAAMDQALGKYFLDFRALEDQHTQATTDENGHQITTIAPRSKQIDQLAEQVWLELESALDGRQLTLGRKTVGLRMGMFETGDYGYRVEIWRVGQISPWYHWTESYPGRANVSQDVGSSGPELPEKLRRFWKEPKADDAAKVE